MIWFFVGLGFLVITPVLGGLYWIRHRRSKKTKGRIISFVALLREPATIDPIIIARAAEKAWNMDLGGGLGEGPDGFVVGNGALNTIMSKGQIFLINNFPNPYVENPLTASEDIPDQRLRTLFAEHKAWFSFDALGVDLTTPEGEIRSLYQRLGPAFAELLDENCLAVFLPDKGMAFAINQDTDSALRSDDPIRSLLETGTVPVIPVADDDPAMIAAVARARKDWPVFVTAFEKQSGENFAIKAPVRHGEVVEFIWVEVKAIEGERIYGVLGNDPANLGPLKLGSKVSVKTEDLNDWIFLDEKGNHHGGFTIQVVRDAARKKGKPD